MQQLARDAAAPLGVQRERGAPREVLRQPCLALAEVPAGPGDEGDGAQHASAHREGRDDVALHAQLDHGAALLRLAAHGEVGGIRVRRDPLRRAGFERARHAAGRRGGHGPEQHRRTRFGRRVAMDDRHASEPVGLAKIDGAPVGE